jgi:hypothetical protein
MPDPERGQSGVQPFPGLRCHSILNSTLVHDAALERGRAGACPPSQPANLLKLNGKLDGSFPTCKLPRVELSFCDRAGY